MMLKIVKGPTCYKDIKCLDGKVQFSFWDACFKMGFPEDGGEYVAPTKEEKD